MTETTTLPINFAKLDEEFAKPCQWMVPPRQCEHQATFVMWSKHTVVSGCPGTLYVCDKCMAHAIEIVSEGLKFDRAVCASCLQLLTGLVTDNLRFIKL